MTTDIAYLGGFVLSLVGFSFALNAIEADSFGNHAEASRSTAISLTCIIASCCCILLAAGIL